MKRVMIKTPYITLGQLLKKVGVVQSGGETKQLLAEQRVSVDQEIEERRGRKLYPGTLVEVMDIGQFLISE